MLISGRTSWQRRGQYTSVSWISRREEGLATRALVASVSDVGRFDEVVA